MLFKLLIFLGVIGAYSAHYNHNDSSKIQIDVDKDQMQMINDAYKHEQDGPIVRDVMIEHLDSMTPGDDPGSYKLTFRFKKD